MINWRSTESTDLQYSGTSLWSSLGQSREVAGGSLYEVELAEHINSYLKTSSQSLVLAGRSALDVGTRFNSSIIVGWACSALLPLFSLSATGGGSLDKG